MKLTTLQRWAEEYAQRLGITDQVHVNHGCHHGSKIQQAAHCHTLGLFRGNVCVSQLRTPRAEWAQFTGIKGWRWLIAHEVCHLAVKNHNSPYFHKRMAALGFQKEKRLAQVAGVIRHRHAWTQPYPFGGGASRSCRVCSATQHGSIRWEAVHKEL